MGSLKLKMWPRIGGLSLLLLLLSCSDDSGTGAVKVRWDRDSCERCRMVLSDRHFAAQVRYFPQGKRSKVMKFDDIGCAVLWLEDKPWKQHSATEIWVADHRSGAWINARTATYVQKKTSPMEYGLGAQAEPVAGGLNFEQASAYIHEVEEKFNVHGLQLQQRLKEQALKRQSQREALLEKTQ